MASIKYGSSRPLGKSIAMDIASEKLLDERYTVCKVSRNKTEIMKRKGHLTRITLIENEGIPSISFDECY